MELYKIYAVYFIPILLICFFLCLKWNGFITNPWMEIMIAIYIVLFYTYLNLPLGIFVLILTFLWFLYRIYYSKIIYEINYLNKTSQKGKIPKRIIQTGPTNNLSKYSSYISLVKSMNPEYEYLFFNDQDINLFFKEYYPNYFETYEKLPLLIQRIDFFRYVAVYHYGGIYLDLDMRILKPFDEEFLCHKCVLPIDEYLKDYMIKWKRYQPFLQQNCHFLLGQYAFAAESKSPFVLNLVENIHQNIDWIVSSFQNQKRNKREREWFVYQTTGPDYVTQQFINYHNKSEIFILDCGQRQHLGRYAKHDYLGSWK